VCNDYIHGAFFFSLSPHGHKSTRRVYESIYTVKYRYN